MAFKTYADWKGNLSDYLQIGDLVDDEIVENFENVLPPAFWNSYIIQMGEPYSHDAEGRPTYPTLHKLHQGWTYAGHCYRGKTENVE